MAESAIYLYCVTGGSRAPALSEAPRGLPGCGRPRAVDAGERLWLVVADAPRSRYGEEAVRRGLENLDWVARCAMAHEAVVEHCMAKAAVVPMRLLTLFDDEERACRAIRGRRKELSDTLDRVSGCSEWGVRVLLDEARAQRLGREQVAGARDGGGASYLAAKKKARDITGELARNGRAFAEALFGELAGKLPAAIKRPAPEVDAAGSVLLDAAFLVPKRQSKQFERRVATAARELGDRAGCQLTLSGPFPPYSFVTSAARKPSGVRRKEPR